MKIHVRDFFKEYYELEDGLKRLRDSCPDELVARESLTWATRSVVGEISIRGAVNKYPSYMRIVKRELYLPCLSEQKHMTEDSLVVLPWDIRVEWDGIKRFVGSELRKLDDIDYEPAKGTK